MLCSGPGFSLACLHVGSGSGANESSPLSAKRPIRRVHTWHFCAASLGRASWKWVSQGSGGACPVTVEPQGWGPCDSRWLLPWLLSLFPCRIRDWNTKAGCIHPGAQHLFALKSPEQPSVPTRFRAVPSQQAVPAPSANPQCRGGPGSAFESLSLFLH